MVLKVKPGEAEPSELSALSFKWVRYLQVFTWVCVDWVSALMCFDIHSDLQHFYADMLKIEVMPK